MKDWNDSDKFLIFTNSSRSNLNVEFYFNPRPYETAPVISVLSLPTFITDDISTYIFFFFLNFLRWMNKKTVIYYLRLNEKYIGKNKRMLLFFPFCLCSFSLRFSQMSQIKYFYYFIYLFLQENKSKNILFYFQKFYLFFNFQNNHSIENGKFA